MSLAGIFNVARSALLAHKWAINVTANNIANAQTPGYSRQRVILEASSVGGLGMGWGGGVRATSLVRMRDEFYDAAYWREQGGLGTSETMRYYLEQVEGAVGEPSDTGVAASLDEFFQAFSGLANDSSNAVAREEVRGAALRFTQHLRSLRDSVNTQMSQAVEQMQFEIEQVNALTEQIAALNQDILAVGNQPNPELLDQRDRLLDELSGRLSIQVLHEENGSVSVTSEGMSLVTGTSAQAIQMQSLPGGGFGFGPGPGPGAAAPAALKGSLAALSQLTASTLPDYLTRLDALAAAVVTEVNALHRTGITAGGNTGVDFFNAAGTTAGTIALSAAVQGSADEIAAGVSGATGDGGLARQIGGLTNQRFAALQNQTFVGYYSGFVAGVGRAVRGAVEGHITAQTLATQAMAWRESVSGVSIEEEMVNLVGQQEAYGAAARLVNVADQMVQEILALVS